MLPGHVHCGMRSTSASTVDADSLLRRARWLLLQHWRAVRRWQKVAGMLRYFIARRRRVGKSCDKAELRNVSGGSLVVSCDRYTVVVLRTGALWCWKGEFGEDTLLPWDLVPNCQTLNRISKSTKQIKSQIAATQIESLMVKSNPVGRFNRDLNRIVIGICPSLVAKCVCWAYCHLPSELDLDWMSRLGRGVPGLSDVQFSGELCSDAAA